MQSRPNGCRRYGRDDCWDVFIVLKRVVDVTAIRDFDFLGCRPVGLYFDLPDEARPSIVTAIISRAKARAIT